LQKNKSYKMKNKLRLAGILILILSIYSCSSDDEVQSINNNATKLSREAKKELSTKINDSIGLSPDNRVMEMEGDPSNPKPKN